LHIEVPRIKFEKFTEEVQGESSASIRVRVEKARGLQSKRFLDSPTVCNSEMSSQQIKNYCRLDEGCIELMKNAVSNLHLSARAYYRIVKVARTIADLTEAENIAPDHIAEAIQYRFKAE
jgi:magnesium chelatase family protein